MLAISAKGIYGLSALYELAINYNTGHIQIRDIAEAHHIPQHYLEQLLIILKKAGIVKSFRGNQGGYTLAKSPHDITLLEILQCLEGNLAIIPTEKRDNALNFFWHTLQNTIARKLGITLYELVLKKQEYEKNIIYNI